MSCSLGRTPVPVGSALLPRRRRLGGPLAAPRMARRCGRTVADPRDLEFRYRSSLSAYALSTAAMLTGLRDRRRWRQPLGSSPERRRSGGGARRGQAQIRFRLCRPGLSGRLYHRHPGFLGQPAMTTMAIAAGHRQCESGPEMRASPARRPTRINRASAEADAGAGRPPSRAPRLPARSIHGTP
jgi:hypothetical protein